MTSDFAQQSYGSSKKLGPGSRIAGYLIEEQIGAGGMGAVFRARDEVLGRLAAVKVVAPSAAGGEEFRTRFLRESRIAAAVNSPHIIPVYGAGEAEGLLYIATRFVPGGDLERLRRRSGGTLAPVLAGALLAQVASALDTAHAAGLVHRDVKPHNVLVDSAPGQPDHAFLSDFGISKGTGFETGLTVTGQFVGTPGFCAPEQIKGASRGRAGRPVRARLCGVRPAHGRTPVPPRRYHGDVVRACSRPCATAVQRLPRTASRRRRRDRTGPGEVAGRPLQRVRRVRHRSAGGAVPGHARCRSRSPGAGGPHNRRGNGDRGKRQTHERDNRRRRQRWPQQEHVRPGPRSRTGEGSWHLGRSCGRRTRRTRRGRRGGYAAPCSVSWTRASYCDAVPVGRQPGTFRSRGRRSSAGPDHRGCRRFPGAGQG